MNFSSDLCTLGTLTESTLLCSIEQRCSSELTESYVGGVLLSLGPSNKITGPQFLPSFASSVLRSLAFTRQDQSILISGYHGADKKKLSYNLLSALLTHLEEQIPSIGPSLLVVSELLNFLSHSDEEECGGAVLVTTLFISPTNLTLTAANVSLLLLDTHSVSRYKVFQQRNGSSHVESFLKRLGMDPGLVQQVSTVLGVIYDLLNGTKAAHGLSGIGVAKLSVDLREDSLGQLLYAYLVQWIVCWVNSNCLGAAGSGSLVSLVCAPGHCFSSESSTLSALIVRYANEVLHNIYCTRLFIWEQEQYLEEGVKWDSVEVEFNESLINCFHQEEEERGLLEVLGLSDEAERRAGVERCGCVSGDSCFVLEHDKNRFALVHFTGEQEYVTDEVWLETDQVQVVSPALQTSLLSSSCGVVVGMAENMRHSADVLPHSEKMASCTLTQRAKKAMDSVCEVLTSSQPHFVFCFMPSENQKRAFNCEFVLNQLQQFKILDIALIQSCGFPVRLKHSDFLKNYSVLCVDENAGNLSGREKCVVILDTAHLKEWHVGLNMVMLKPWHLQQLDSALDLFNQSAKKLQRVFRRSILRKRQSLPTSSLSVTSPPSPPPRPSYTLSNPQQVAPAPSSPRSKAEYAEASSPPPSPPKATSRKKGSWKKTSRHSSFSKSIPDSADLQSLVWFQGRLSRDKAEDLLQEVQFDCFLVRESENRVGEYALSLRHGGIIKHFRIDTKRGQNSRYELYGAKRSFLSLEILVDYYSHHCISSGGELLSVPYSTEDQQQRTTRLKRKLSSIRRPKPSLVAVPVTESKLPRTQTTPTLDSNSRSHSLPFRAFSLDIAEDSTEDSTAALQRELEVEERIVEAARRMAELPTSNRRERQKRKQSLQLAQSRFLSLKQQFHTLQERQRFIESSMQNTPN